MKIYFKLILLSSFLFGCASKNNKIDSVQLNEHELILEPATSHDFILTNASVKTILVSSDESIVQVLSNKTIKALKEGRATITAKDLDTKKEDQCKVVVRYKTIDPLNSLGVATIAHKGYHVEAIENTYEAFVEAGRRNFYGIETDIHQTKDGYWICNHDNKVKGMSKNVSECTLDEIMEVNLSENPEKIVKICKFEEYINACYTYNKHPIVELKEIANRQKLEDVVSILSSFSVLDEVIFISKLGDVLGTLYNIKVENSYKYDLQMLTEGTGWQYVPEMLNVSSQYEAITKSMVESCVAGEQYVAAWTVNDFETANSLIGFGVKYITTDLYECAERFVDKTLFGI